MGLHLNRDNYQTYRAYRALLDDKLTELALYTKELCPEAVVEVSAISYTTKTGTLIFFLPLGFQRTKKRESS